MARTIGFFKSYGILSNGVGTGAELFATDGTAQGTGLVQDIRSGEASSDPDAITPLAAGGVVFAASDGPSLGKQLFVSNGTANGTVELVGSFIPVARPGLGALGATNSSLASFASFGLGALFAGATGQGAVQLWYTDGTFAGTRPVRDFAPDPSVAIDGIADLGAGRAVFDVGSGAAQPGLWATDGTTAGTVWLSDQASRATPIGKGLAITALDSGFGFTSNYVRTVVLGVTDGTAAGTRTLTTFSSGSTLSPVSTIAATRPGQALFGGLNSNGGYDLWVTDGTSGGTVRLLGGPAGGFGIYAGLDPNGYTALGDGRTLFAGSNGTGGRTVWITDGTAAGTVALVDTAAGTRGDYINGFTPFGVNRALFAVVNASTGATTVWSTNGTASGTVPIQSFPQIPGAFSTAIYPLGGLAALPNGRAVFTAGGVAGAQVFTTDGTAAGTSVIATLPSRPVFSPSAPMVLPNGQVVFTVTAPSGFSANYATDGTAAGTVQISGAAFSGKLAIAAAAEGTPGLPPPSPDPLFDTNYYLARNPDVAASGIDPYQHYVVFGGAEGRNPDAFFDSRYYLTQNPDVAAAGVNPLLHYERDGFREGRDPSLLFSSSRYLIANPDVAAAGANPLLHFIQYGQTEGRPALLPFGTTAYDPLVDPAFYDAQLGATLIPLPVNGGAAQAVTSYDQLGWQRGLNPNPLFDTTYYLGRNADVAAAHVNPLVHYEQHGWKEGRDPSAAFSSSKYLAANPDIARAGIDPLLHYLVRGQAEGRAIYPA